MCNSFRVYIDTHFSPYKLIGFANFNTYNMHYSWGDLTFKAIINVTRWIIPSEWFVWIILSESLDILLSYIVKCSVLQRLQIMILDVFLFNGMHLMNL